MSLFKNIGRGFRNLWRKAGPGVRNVIRRVGDSIVPEPIQAVIDVVGRRRGGGGKQQPPREEEKTSRPKLGRSSSAMAVAVPTTLPAVIPAAKQIAPVAQSLVPAMTSAFSWINDQFTKRYGKSMPSALAESAGKWAETKGTEAQSWLREKASSSRSSKRKNKKKARAGTSNTGKRKSRRSKYKPWDRERTQR